MNLLESAGFSRSNPYYIVKQGKVLTYMSVHQCMCKLRTCKYELMDTILVGETLVYYTVCVCMIDIRRLCTYVYNMFRAC